MRFRPLWVSVTGVFNSIRVAYNSRFELLACSGLFFVVLLQLFNPFVKRGIVKNGVGTAFFSGNKRDFLLRKFPLPRGIFVKIHWVASLWYCITRAMEFIQYKMSKYTIFNFPLNFYAKTMRSKLFMLFFKVKSFWYCNILSQNSMFYT